MSLDNWKKNEKNKKISQKERVRATYYLVWHKMVTNKFRTVVHLKGIWNSYFWIILSCWANWSVFLTLGLKQTIIAKNEWNQRQSERTEEIYLSYLEDEVGLFKSDSYKMEWKFKITYFSFWSSSKCAVCVKSFNAFSLVNKCSLYSPDLFFAMLRVFQSEASILANKMICPVWLE